MNTKTRLPADHRRAQIVQTAKKLSYDGGLYNWGLDDLAEILGISVSAVRYYFYSALGLRAEIIGTAKRERDIPILVQAVATHDPAVEDLPVAVLEQCAAAMRK